MSILNIKEKLSKRILEAEKASEVAEPKPKNPQSKQKDFIPASLKEVDVGITEYVSNLKGFSGVIKQRYSDFCVHEIDENWQLTVLNSYDLPDVSLESEPESSPVISPETVASLERLFSSESTNDSVEIDVTENTKDERKSIHTYLKAKYGTAIESNTVEKDNRKIICASRSSDFKKNRRPGHIPKYLHFVLCKSNMDSNNALSIIASKLRVKSANFNIAGTKDKRANTSQWISVKHVLADQLQKLNKSLRNMKVGNFCYKDYDLSLGSLKGNNFHIALRNISVPDHELNDAMEKIKENGFINYFGLQRFGNNAECPTHEIGRAILKEEFGKAVNLILQPRSGVEPPDMRQAREIFARTKDAGQALSVLHRNNHSIEAKVLASLKKNGPNSFVNALDNTSRKVYMMYMHAYQSLIWNKIVSRRIAKFGLKVLPGDLRLMKNGAPNGVDSSDKSTVENISNGNECSDEEDTNHNENESDLKKEKMCPVQHIDESGIDQYSLSDILLPIPGSDVTYPNNEIADWYNELLEEDGLSSESWDARIKKYALPGSYRKLLGCMKNLSWKTVKYTHPDSDILMSDVEIMEGRTIPETPDGKYTALTMKFDLEQSSYATMALREVLRADTSTSSQTELNESLLKRSGEPVDEIAAKRRKEYTESIDQQ